MRAGLTLPDEPRGGGPGDAGSWRGLRPGQRKRSERGRRTGAGTGRGADVRMDGLGQRTPWSHRLAPVRRRRAPYFLSRAARFSRAAVLGGEAEGRWCVRAWVCAHGCARMTVCLSVSVSEPTERSSLVRADPRATGSRHGNTRASFQGCERGTAETGALEKKSFSPETTASEAKRTTGAAGQALQGGRRPGPPAPEQGPILSPQQAAAGVSPDYLVPDTPEAVGGTEVTEVRPSGTEWS